MSIRNLHPLRPLTRALSAGLLAASALAAALGIMGAPAAAQSPFAPAIFVNDRAITAWEIDQNTRFLTLLGQPGDVGEIAVERLIEDRLRLDAAAALGLTVSDAQIEAGMAEFASRANLTTEEFLAAVGQAGVEPETFRAFVRAGLLWREVIRARFGPRVQVSDADVRRALDSISTEGGTRVLLSEIILRAGTPEEREAALLVAGRIADRDLTEAEFAARATEISAAPSRERGGQLEWQPLDGFPPEAAEQFRRMTPGDISRPIETETSVGVFLLRDRKEISAAEAQAQFLEWAELAVTGAGEAAEVAAQVDTCDDLYGVVPGAPESRLRREAVPEGQVPGDLGPTLAALDVGETAVVTRGGAPVLVMLCRRGFGPGEEGTRPTEAQVREQLLNQRLAGYAESYLAELRAEASIRYQ